MRWVFWAAVVVAGAVAACVGDDSSAVDGGGKDAAVEAAAGYCATHTTGTTFVCADFDGPSLDAGWTSSVTSGGGSLSLESTDFSSPPNALLAKLPASTTPTKALLQLDPVGAPAQFSGAVRLAVRSPACFQAGDVVTIAALQFFTSNVLTYEIDLQLEVNGTLMVMAQNEAESGVNSQQFGANQLMPLNAWVDLELDLTTAGTPHANLVMNGQVVLGTDLLPRNAAGLPRFLLGAEADHLASSTCAIELDDVTLDHL